MPLILPTLTEKCKGAMVATAIGDALGWPNEVGSKNRNKKMIVDDRFTEWSRSSKKPRWHTEIIRAGEYSDDTQLTLAVARSIISGDWEKSLSERELPFWIEYERGGGSAILRAAAGWRDKKCPLWKTSSARKYFNAGGNGAAMRILPHVIANCCKGNLKQLMDDIFRDAILTHGHPRAILGAMCYAYALNYLLNKDSVLEYGELINAVLIGEEEWSYMPFANDYSEWIESAHQQCGFDYFGVWSDTSVRMLNQLESMKESLKKGLFIKDETIMGEIGAFGDAKGAGDVAVLCAIFLLSKYANNPKLAITIPANSFGADTDTIGSMTGGLVGMLSGLDWIPIEWKLVQDYDCFIQITELLLSDNKLEVAKDIASETRSHDHEYNWQHSQIGDIRLICSTSVPNGKHGMVEIKKWETAMGQSIYFKDFVPNQKEPSSPVVNDSFQYKNQYTIFDTNSSIDITKDKIILEHSPDRLVLDQNAIREILCCPSLKKKMTIGKALEIISFMLSKNAQDIDVSKKFGIDQAMINTIKKFIEH